MTPSFIGRIAVMLPGAAEHRFRRQPDFLDHLFPVGPAFLADRDNRRLVEHDALPAHVDQRVGGAEVDRQVVVKVAAQETQHNVFRLKGFGLVAPAVMIPYAAPIFKAFVRRITWH